MGNSSNPANKKGVSRTDLVWGDRRGHPTQRRVLPPRRVQKKAVASERVKTIRSVIREVSGFAPYERRAMELIRNSKVCYKGWVVSVDVPVTACVSVLGRDDWWFRWHMLIRNDGDGNDSTILFHEDNTDNAGQACAQVYQAPYRYHWPC